MGMAVDLVDDQGKPLTRTKITFISPHVDTDSQTLLVKTQVPNADMKFRNAQQVHARVVWSERKATVIPITAVTRLSGKLFAFVAEGNGQQAVARQRVIQVGDLVGNDYVVLDGIDRRRQNYYHQRTDAGRRHAGGAAVVKSFSPQISADER